MATAATPPSETNVTAVRISPLDANISAGPTAKIGMGLFGVVLLGGVIYIGRQLIGDLAEVHSPTIMPYLLLGLALLVALGFEFVNGFHDTANAVATVIYTHSLEPHVAVVWSGFWNFIGVVLSSGAVAFGIMSLLPVELILQVGSGAGFCYGVRAADRGNHLESRDLVLRPAGVQLAHADRLDHRRGYCESADVCARRERAESTGRRPRTSESPCSSRRWSDLHLRRAAPDGLQSS